MLMTTKEIVDFLENNHVIDIVEYDKPANWINYGIIGTATTSRHISMLIDEFKDTFGKGKIGIDGENSTWAIITVNNIMIHIFVQETREYYTLDDLWRKNKIDFNE